MTSESIRTLRTNLQFSSVDNKLKTLLITSTLPSEGKSFVSSNLATSFAHTGKRVLIIDCDLRKGRQHEIFRVPNRMGLSNLLLSDLNDYSKYICKTDVGNVFLLPRGPFPPNPSELLNSNKNATLLTILQNFFDLIILDGAPLSGLADSLILSKMVDKVLIIGSINNRPKTELKNVINSLNKVGANIAGFVANNIPASRGQYGYYNYYGSKDENHKVDNTLIGMQDLPKLDQNNHNDVNNQNTIEVYYQAGL